MLEINASDIILNHITVNVKYASVFYSRNKISELPILRYISTLTSMIRMDQGLLDLEENLTSSNLLACYPMLHAYSTLGPNVDRNKFTVGCVFGNHQGLKYKFGNHIHTIDVI